MSIAKLLSWNFLVVCLLLLLPACGGQKTSEQSVSNEQAAAQSGSLAADERGITVSNTNFEFIAQTLSDSTKTIPITLQNLGGVELYSKVEFGANTDAIYPFAELVLQSETSGEIDLSLRSAVNLGEGEFSETVVLSVCLDVPCERHVAGSPLTLIVNVISKGIEAEIALEETNFFVSASKNGGDRPAEIVREFQLSDVVPSDVYLFVSKTDYDNYSSEIYIDQSSVVPSLEIEIADPQFMSAGRYKKEYEISACLDYECNWHLNGSPLDISVVYEVSATPESIDIISPDKRYQKSFNVVDAEFSDSLNALVVASTLPENALYLIRADDGSEVKVPLNREPTAVSVANGGKSKKVAVGHDAYVTWVEFDTENADTFSVKEFSVPASVFDIAATESSVVVMPGDTTWAAIHMIDVASGELKSGSEYSVYGGSAIQLHPELNYVYIAYRSVSPDDIARVDIATPLLSDSIDSKYHGDYPVCGNLWISDDGKRIYTGCGNTFRSNPGASTDMIYAGKIPMYSFDSYTEARAISLAESSTKNEVAIIENSSAWNCEDTYVLSGECVSLLSFNSKDYLNNQSRFGFPITYNADGQKRYENPEFVFYNAAGDEVLILGNVLGEIAATSVIRVLSR